MAAAREGQRAITRLRRANRCATAPISPSGGSPDFDPCKTRQPDGERRIPNVAAISPPAAIDRYRGASAARGPDLIERQFADMPALAAAGHARWPAKGASMRPQASTVSRPGRQGIAVAVVVVGLSRPIRQVTGGACP
ncbi:hypothetical protein [Burkholderia lata]|uniref:hypothetical protein n=1 Tax=Burkholderia lata (strain ATCC 17760 / DSM 23089 / LMG 22485 / NCIMB 9086 / R18194 / 383) TaxID=482957 RepID=UPI00158328D2|nr:hypothetical protein [Burkholderia lata]